MMSRTTARSQRLRVVAQDPAVHDPHDAQQILTAAVVVPVEQLAPGPWGHRVQVIDYDCSADRFTKPQTYTTFGDGSVVDPFAERTGSAALVTDYGFHAQNVYAIVMRTLARFEHALGRRVGWAGNSHQLKAVPHAFAAANAFYAREAEALLFGYFPGADGQMVYTCLSHDVIVHETTHALLDALHEHYMDPSSPDQAAFHEGFADIVALLSVFSLHEVVRALLESGRLGDPISANVDAEAEIVARLRQTALLGLAEQMGAELQRWRGLGGALRRSVELAPSPAYYNDTMGEFGQAHRRGEILVSAVMNAFVSVWAKRLLRGRREGRFLSDLPRVAEEGADAADYLLTMAIRALDYMPPLHITFSDYLSALITADMELRPDDTRFGFRDQLRAWFDRYGIQPVRGNPVPSPEGVPAPPTASPPLEQGAWSPIGAMQLTYDRTHFEPLTRDPDEVFRFIWENHEALGLDSPLNQGAFMKVLWVRPCVRTAPDGFVLRETVAEFYQVIRLRADELKDYKIARPAGMPDGLEVPLYGGGTLIFDDYGRLKYYIHNALDNAKRQGERIQELWQRGALSGRSLGSDLAAAHRLRAASPADEKERW